MGMTAIMPRSGSVANAREEAEEQKDRNGEFLHHRDPRGDRRIEQRNPIFVLKQFHREFPGSVLQQAGLEERGADAQSPANRTPRENVAGKDRHWLSSSEGSAS